MKYKTTQKELIGEFLTNNKNNFVSAEDIISYLKENNLEVGLTTVYRFLNSLEKDNMLRVEVKNHTKFYQIITDECEDHFHLKCKKCGNEIHLDCSDFEKVNKHIKKEHSFNIDHNAIIYGTCDKCL